ncbi:PASTA domain-containing protein [Plantibacter sp. RU18]|uniref:PASTA domain-containing protein n=1 Tax=Plantibacter sp. RU18 TaxID=3158143 RepID=UPI003D360A76
MSSKLTRLASGVIAMLVLAGCSTGGSSAPDPTTSASSRIEVPDVVGLQVDVAEDQLEVLGFDVEVENPEFDEAIADADLIVITQSVGQGEYLNRGATITLTADKAQR